MPGQKETQQDRNNNMTTRRHNANPFARVLGAATMAASRPASAAHAPSQPLADAAATTPPPPTQTVPNDAAAPSLSAASQRWRNYTPPAAAVPETAPTVREASEPAAPAAAPASGRPSANTRWLALRTRTALATQQAETIATAAATTTTETYQDSAASTTPRASPTPTASAVPTAKPVRTPSPVSHLPLAISANADVNDTKAEPAAPSSCLQQPAPSCDHLPSDVAHPLARSLATMPNPAPVGTDTAAALTAALAEVARQRALVARLVAVVAADCPACCAKVVTALVDAPVSQGVPSAPVAAVPLATGLPQQHNHFHLSIESRRESSHADRLRRKAMGVARKPSSGGRRTTTLSAPVL
nr:hypothetical protein [Pandoravirus massiliensis]